MLSRDKLTTLVIISEPQGERYLTWRRLILTLKLQLESQHHCVSKRTEILRKQRNIMTHLVLKYTGLPWIWRYQRKKTNAIHSKTILHFSALTKYPLGTHSKAISFYTEYEMKGKYSSIFTSHHGLLFYSLLRRKGIWYKMKLKLRCGRNFKWN